VRHKGIDTAEAGQDQPNEPSGAPPLRMLRGTREELDKRWTGWWIGA